MNSKPMEQKIPIPVLDDLSARFLIGTPEIITLHPEEYFFNIEEAYWFALDFYSLKCNSLMAFSQQILAHNGIEVNLCWEYDCFKKYKQSIKVYGTIIFSRDFNYVLLVQQTGGSNSITFPKGKKAKNETGMECAIRETQEEVGINVKDKIVDISVTVFDKITFYCVFNVDIDYSFKTNTRNEISRIFWFDLRNLKQVKDNSVFKIFYTAYSGIEDRINEIKKKRFRFDTAKILKEIESVKSSP